MINYLEIVTLFPNMFSQVFDTTVFKRAREIVEMKIVDLRDFSSDKRKNVDDTPYGGGCGMILKPEPLAGALESFREKARGGKIIYLSPQGSLFNQSMAENLVKNEKLAFVCGRYEGIDQRVIDLYVDEEISVGDYVLAGGELPAMIVLEALVRLMPGVLGNEESPKMDSFSCGLLKYPQYTRPEEFKGLKVPEILLSGDHKKIAHWRNEQSVKKTKKARPDLYEKADNKKINI